MESKVDPAGSEKALESTDCEVSVESNLYKEYMAHLRHMEILNFDFIKQLSALFVIVISASVALRPFNSASAELMAGNLSIGVMLAILAGAVAFLPLFVMNGLETYTDYCIDRKNPLEIDLAAYIGNSDLVNTVEIVHGRNHLIRKKIRWLFWGFLVLSILLALFLLLGSKDNG